MNQKRESVQPQYELKLAANHATKITNALGTLTRGIDKLEGEFAVKKEKGFFPHYEEMLSLLRAGAAAMAVLELLADGLSTAEVVETTLPSA